LYHTGDCVMCSGERSCGLWLYDCCRGWCRRLGRFSVSSSRQLDTLRLCRVHISHRRPRDSASTWQRL